jgi:hypothetical protein
MRPACVRICERVHTMPISQPLGHLRGQLAPQSAELLHCHLPRAHFHTRHTGGACASQDRKQDVSPRHSRIRVQPVHPSRGSILHIPSLEATKAVCFTERHQQDKSAKAVIGCGLLQPFILRPSTHLALSSSHQQTEYVHFCWPCIPPLFEVKPVGLKRVGGALRMADSPERHLAITTEPSSTDR